MKLSEHIKGLFSDKLALTKNIAKLFSLEAKLASMSAGPLIVNLVLLLCLSSTVWLLVTGLVIYTVLILGYNFAWALAVGILFNSIIIGILIKSSLKHIEHMKFPKTRACLQNHKDS